ncbi:hypothetical protein [Paenibacillus periandrae]|uniref:hypothetical protein n=1 Tax=Paenibacillus periandrae TaxID=1761741 RepID=UPI001F0970F7|nr:hypothetical protein [Paenibacillus periandrae]
MLRKLFGKRKTKNVYVERQKQIPVGEDKPSTSLDEMTGEIFNGCSDVVFRAISISGVALNGILCHISILY